MKLCWEVDYKSRPTFEQLTPKIKELLNDSHKQVIFFLILSTQKHFGKVKIWLNSINKIFIISVSSKDNNCVTLCFLIS